MEKQISVSSVRPALLRSGGSIEAGMARLWRFSLVRQRTRSRLRITPVMGKPTSLSSVHRPANGTYFEVKTPRSLHFHSERMEMCPFRQITTLMVRRTSPCFVRRIRPGTSHNHPEHRRGSSSLAQTEISLLFPTTTETEKPTSVSSVLP